MSALLKIVQGPNAGAEIALPDGVEITVGKADTCDIVLADSTLPDAPLKLSADASGSVTLDGAPLEPYHVRLFGSTALAVGPADAAWSPLVFPSPEPTEKPDDKPTSDNAPAPSPAGKSAVPSASASDKKEKRGEKRRGWGCFLWLLVILALLAVAAWFFRESLAPVYARVQTSCDAHVKPFWASRFSKKTPTPKPAPVLADFADHYGLTLEDSGLRPTFSGNFATRAERLAATADLYSTFPGVSLDLTDDESLRSAVADSLFTLGQSSLTVAAVSNRVASLAGLADSPADLSADIDALRADVPRLAEVDTSAVNFRSPVALASATSPATDGTGTVASRRRTARAASTNPPATPTLPVCGILTTPYPCLVLQNGTRVFPGAPLGGSVVVSIAADSVVLTNANGSFTWKP